MHSDHAGHKGIPPAYTAAAHNSHGSRRVNDIGKFCEFPIAAAARGGRITQRILRARSTAGRDS